MRSVRPSVGAPERRDTTPSSCSLVSATRAAWWASLWAARRCSRVVAGDTRVGRWTCEAASANTSPPSSLAASSRVCVSIVPLPIDADVAAPVAVAAVAATLASACRAGHAAELTAIADRFDTRLPSHALWMRPCSTIFLYLPTVPSYRRRRRRRCRLASSGPSWRCSSCCRCCCTAWRYAAGRTEAPSWTYPSGVRATAPTVSPWASEFGHLDPVPGRATRVPDRTWRRGVQEWRISTVLRVRMIVNWVNTGCEYYSDNVRERRRHRYLRSLTQ